mgnify:CR=1 FL=1
MMSTIPVSFRLNGMPQACTVKPETRLSEILRDHLGQSASKTACGICRCGACLVMAWQVGGSDIVSPEGLDAFPETRLVRQGLVEEAAFQCGYCAPGFVVALTALLRENPHADETDIRAALEGNLCRCTGYHSIIRGALRAAGLLLQAHQQAAQAGRPT